MKGYASNIINQIRKDLEESGQTVDESRIQVFKIIQDAERVKYKKGLMIVKEGEPIKNILFLANGFIKSYRDIGEKRLFIHIMKPGDFLGLSSCGEIKFAPYSLETLENSVVYHIPKEAVTHVLYREPLITKWVINNLTEYVLAYYNKISFLSSKNMHSKVADVLLMFSEEIFKKDVYQIPITKKQLGHYANVSPENVTRIMKTFVADNVIEMKGKLINILNKDKLKKISLTEC